MKFGILGGAFDPVHRGHTYVARKVVEIFDLDCVFFMISNFAPHKERSELSSAYHRYAMVVLEVLNEPRLYCSQLELQRQSCYTIDTLNYFAMHYPQHRHCFIAGTDALREIHLWKDYGRLLREYSFIFVQRPGSQVDLKELKIPESLQETIQVVCEEEKPAIQSGRSFLISLDAPPLSSTSIRKMISSGMSPSGDFISLPVLQYIQKHRLYETNKKRSEESLPGD